MLAMNLFQLFPLTAPTAYQATDGKWFKTAFAAWIHDVAERKWAQLLPTLKDGQVVRETREQLRLTQTELASQAGISQCYLAQLESGVRSITDSLMQKIWGALWRADQERKKAPAAMEMLVRLENDLAVITERREVRL